MAFIKLFMWLVWLLFIARVYSKQQVEVQIENIIKYIRYWQRYRQDLIDQTSLKRPFVTLSYAQSLDGMIGLLVSENAETKLSSSNYPLSGSESLCMTHAIRSIHDAVLVGGSTLSTDNPRLNNRLWNPKLETQTKQPRPVVLDTNLQHIKKLGMSRRATDIIVCCSHEAASTFHEQIQSSVDTDCKESFDDCVLLPCKCTGNGRLDISDVLRQLLQVYSIETIMVEGGASVLEAFVSSKLIDCICITISPKILGKKHGLSVYSDLTELVDVSSSTPIFIKGQNYGCKTNSEGIAWSTSHQFLQLGSDCILLCKT